MVEMHLYVGKSTVGYRQACIICGIAVSWIPGTFFPQALLRDFYDFYAIFANFTPFFARHKMSDPRHLKLLCRPGYRPYR